MTAVNRMEKLKFFFYKGCIETRVKYLIIFINTVFGLLNLKLCLDYYYEKDKKKSVHVSWAQRIK